MCWSCLAECLAGSLLRLLPTSAVGSRPSIYRKCVSARNQRDRRRFRSRFHSRARRPTNNASTYPRLTHMCARARDSTRGSHVASARGSLREGFDHCIVRLPPLPRRRPRPERRRRTRRHRQAADDDDPSTPALAQSAAPAVERGDAKGSGGADDEDDDDSHDEDGDFERPWPSVDSWHVDGAYFTHGQRRRTGGPREPARRPRFACALSASNPLSRLPVRRPLLVCLCVARLQSPAWEPPSLVRYDLPSPSLEDTAPRCSSFLVVPLPVEVPPLARLAVPRRRHAPRRRLAPPRRRRARRRSARRGAARARPRRRGRGRAAARPRVRRDRRGLRREPGDVACLWLLFSG